MELTGFAGLQAAFGGTASLWKARVKAGLPILSEPGLRSGKARLFDSVAVFAWLQEHEPARPCGNLDRNQEQAALFAVQRELKALELAQRKTELIPADVVQRVWSGFTGAARARLLALPSRLAANCCQQGFEEVEHRARAIVYEALNEISEYNPADYA